MIDEALREWHTRHIARQQASEEIRRLWDEGMQSGPGPFGDIEELIQEAKGLL